MCINSNIVKYTKEIKKKILRSHFEVTLICKYIKIRDLAPPLINMTNTALSKSVSIGQLKRQSTPSSYQVPPPSLFWLRTFSLEDIFPQKASSFTTHHLRTRSIAAITFLMSSLARLLVSARTERPDMFKWDSFEVWTN